MFEHVCMQHVHVHVCCLLELEEWTTLLGGFLDINLMNDFYFLTFIFLTLLVFQHSKLVLYSHRKKSYLLIKTHQSLPWHHHQGQDRAQLILFWQSSPVCLTGKFLRLSICELLRLALPLNNNFGVHEREDTQWSLLWRPQEGPTLATPRTCGTCTLQPCLHNILPSSRTLAPHNFWADFRALSDFYHGSSSALKCCLCRDSPEIPSAFLWS